MKGKDKSYPVPPPELFMQTGGVVSKPPEGYPICIEPATTRLSKKSLKQIMRKLGEVHLKDILGTNDQKR